MTQPTFQEARRRSLKLARLVGCPQGGRAGVRDTLHVSGGEVGVGEGVVLATHLQNKSLIPHSVMVHLLRFAYTSVSKNKNNLTI